MTDLHVISVDAQDDADFVEHEKTYRLFLMLIKFGLIVVVAVLIILAVLTL